MHFDLITTDFDAEVDRLIGLGAAKLNEINAGSRHGQETVIFLVNNRGYVPGSAIHDGSYRWPPQARCHFL